MPEPERIDRRRAVPIADDVCRRALTPSDPARRAGMRPARCLGADDRGSAGGSCDKAMKMYARIRRLDQVAAMLLGSRILIARAGNIPGNLRGLGRGYRPAPGV
jgi:hypothetical protein